MDEFARSFGDCERVWVLDIYAASELPIHGITSEKLVERMWELGFRRGRYAASEQHLINEVLAEARSGDLIMTIGAGNVWKIGELVAARLQSACEKIEVVKE